MKLARLLAGAVAAAFLAAAAPAPQPSLTAAAQRVRADVEFLASDLLEGRDTGSRGYDIAAAYVASEFGAVGLKPAGTRGSWYQEVPFRRASRLGEPAASLTLNGRSVPLRPRLDFAVRPSLSQQLRSLDAPLVFAGYGISDPRAGINDYASLDVRGKVVVVLQGTPPGLHSEIAAHLDSVKLATALRRGAAGLLEIAGTGPNGGGNLVHFERPMTSWLDQAGRASTPAGRLGVYGAISIATAERLFAAARQNLASTRRSASRGRGVRGFQLPARLKLSDRSRWEPLVSSNVIGLLPGSDPAVAGEYVVLMGHLDHLGVKADAKPGEDRIYNGAIDNAAGIATLLEAARKFVASGTPPRRSVLFIAVTAEERGLLGADYYAEHPTVPKGSIVGLVNLDMPMLLYDFTDIVAFGGEHSTLARDIEAASRSMGVSVSPDPMPDEAIFVRSDHYRFVTRGIPAVMLMTGYANGGERKWKDFFADTYHKANDDLSQPIRFDQAARYAELNYRIARAIADAPRRPLWYRGDYFGESFAPNQERAAR